MSQTRSATAALTRPPATASGSLIDGQQVPATSTTFWEGDNPLEVPISRRSPTGSGRSKSLLLWGLLVAALIVIASVAIALALTATSGPVQ